MDIVVQSGLDEENSGLLDQVMHDRAEGIVLDEEDDNGDNEVIRTGKEPS